jgi:hypothetical protein
MHLYPESENRPPRRLAVGFEKYQRQPNHSSPKKAPIRASLIPPLQLFPFPQNWSTVNLLKTGDRPPPTFNNNSANSQSNPQFPKFVVFASANTQNFPKPHKTSPRPSAPLPTSASNPPPPLHQPTTSENHPFDRW